MDEAATLFLRHGYEGTSLRQLADVVGMKAGSLYYHFASKDELLTEILRRGIDVMQQAFDAAAAATDRDDPESRVGAHVRAHLAALFENGPYTAAHVMTFRTSPEVVREAVVPMRDAYEARWTGLLVEMQEAGRIRSDTDVRIGRLALFGAMNSAVEWFDPTRGNLDEFAASITQQFWNGVAA
ncbi:TetR/AcrR family transcriptional regulator [Ilumatobacter sp.]|uniref:TetR/AcrR family transcriptional regulator n=1 Tax=Ilumatobacter sp. TaxID=1967498 RepID=UPI003AF632A4